MYHDVLLPVAKKENQIASDFWFVDQNGKLKIAVRTIALSQGRLSRDFHLTIQGDADI